MKAMKVANLILCILNAVFFAFNICTQNYFVAAINGLAILLTAQAVLVNS